MIKTTFSLNMPQEIQNTLTERKDLTTEQIEFFLKESIKGNIPDEEKIKILELQNKKGISSQEISSAVNYLQKNSQFIIHNSKFTIDICGTGGSGLPRINTSTLSAFVLAALGVSIGKHGNRAASGRFGSFDLLEKLGIKIDLSPEQSKEVTEKTGLGFFFAPKCYPEMGAFMPARKALGKPCMFNLLGPLLSPLSPKRQIIGTSNEKNAELLIEAAKHLEKEKVFVVVGEGGLDEVTLTGKTHVWEFSPSQGELEGVKEKSPTESPFPDKIGVSDSVIKRHSPQYLAKGDCDGENSENFQIKKYTLTPEDFGLEIVNFEQISGGTPEKNIQIAEDFLSGKITDTPHGNLIHINVALALKLVGKEEDLKKGVELSKEVVNSGKVREKFEQVVKMTKNI